MEKSSSPTLEKNKLDLRIETILRDLKIDGTLDGMHYLTRAIHAAVLDPTATRRITKSLYIDTAQYFGTKPGCIERSIRTAVRISWEGGGREELDRMAGYHLFKRPTNSRFIDIISAYIRQNPN